MTNYPKALAPAVLVGISVGVIAAFLNPSHPVTTPQPSSAADPEVGGGEPPKRIALAPAVELPLTTEQIVARSETSVALVRGNLGGSGTGFLIRTGVLVTNAHVIAGEQVSDLKVTFPAADPDNQNPSVGLLLWEDVGRDLAFLTVDSTLPALAINDSYRFRRGQDVTVIGNPGTVNGQTLINAVSRGVMSTETKIEGRAYFQISIAINPGNSGSPVIDPDGLVIGVATAGDPKRQGLAFCVPAGDLAEADRRVRMQPARDSRKATAMHDLRSLVDNINKCEISYIKTLYILADSIDQFALARCDSIYNRKMLYKSYREGLGQDFDKIANETLYPQVCSAANDEMLPRDVRNDLRSLWENYLELRRANEQLGGTSDSLRASARQLQARHEWIVARLQRSFSQKKVP